MKSKFVPLGGSSDPIAYCAYHKFTLSKNQLKAKGCLEKDCKRLIKRQHPYWDRLEEKKAQSKQFREERKRKLKQQEKEIDRSKLIKGLKYCVNSPCKLNDEVDYCSQCPAGDRCMSGLVNDAYEYLIKYNV